jgi:hypothetical protein
MMELYTSVAQRRRFSGRTAVLNKRSMTAHTLLYGQQLLLFGRSALARSDSANSTTATSPLPRSPNLRPLRYGRRTDSIAADIAPYRWCTPSMTGYNTTIRSVTALIGAPLWKGSARTEIFAASHCRSPFNEVVCRWMILFHQRNIIFQKSIAQQQFTEVVNMVDDRK